jgi:integrase
MPRVHLTHRALRSLSTDRLQEDFWDDLLPGFGVRITNRGRKTFVLRYRANGRKRRISIGTHPPWSLKDARDEAKEILGKAAKGEDLQAARKRERAAETFGELAEEYLERHAKRRKKSWREDQRKLEKDLLPAWRNRKAKDITRREVIRLVEGIVDRGSPVSANRTLALISKIFNFGIDMEIVDINPAQRVRPPAKESSRDVVLKEDEIRALWQALEEEDPIVAGTFKLRLLTAQRGIEVFSMRWSDIDGEWWTIPAEVSKNGLQHRVPLSPQALAVLELLRPLSGDSEWVFDSPKKPGTHIVAIRKAAVRIAERARVEFTAHDLRRTAATHMASMGVSRLTISKILNHVERGITAIYDRASYDAEKERALLRWGEKVARIGSGSGKLAPVVSIR